VVQKNGDVFVADGHAEGTNQRIVKVNRHGGVPFSFRRPSGYHIDANTASTSPTRLNK
jgi:hypothetical protein